MKLLLLDADVIIDLLGFDLFDSLLNAYEVYVCSTVIDEIKTYKSQGITVPINFRQRYIDTTKVIELSAYSTEMKEMIERIPTIFRGTIDAGESESLTVLYKRSDLDLFFCSCDARAIKFLSYLRISNKGISLEKILNTVGQKGVNLQKRHTERYFKDNLRQGSIEFIQNINLKK